MPAGERRQRECRRAKPGGRPVPSPQKIKEDDEQGKLCCAFQYFFLSYFLDALLTHRTTAPTGAYPLPKPNKIKMQRNELVESDRAPFVLLLLGTSARLRGAGEARKSSVRWGWIREDQGVNFLFSLQ